MARTTTNYGFNISEGTDLVNPLTDIFPNFEDIDTDLKAVSDSAIGTATELTTGTVHAITRSDSDRDVFVFIATSNWTTGDTITVDGTQVSILTPDGQALATGAYIIGSAVLCVLNGTLITAIVNAAKAKDSDKLDGEDSTYYATASDLSNTDGIVSGLSTKVGSAVLNTTAQDCSGAINELNAGLSDKPTQTVVSVNASAGTYGSQLAEVFAAIDHAKLNAHTKIWDGKQAWTLARYDNTSYYYFSLLGWSGGVWYQMCIVHSGSDNKMYQNNNDISSTALGAKTYTIYYLN